MNISFIFISTKMNIVEKKCKVEKRESKIEKEREISRG